MRKALEALTAAIYLTAGALAFALGIAGGFYALFEVPEDKRGELMIIVPLVLILYFIGFVMLQKFRERIKALDKYELPTPPPAPSDKENGEK